MCVHVYYDVIMWTNYLPFQCIGQSVNRSFFTPTQIIDVANHIYNNPSCTYMYMQLITNVHVLIVLQGLEGLPLLQDFSCAENHLPKVDGLANCSLLQHLRLSQNNLQLVTIISTDMYIILCRGGALGSPLTCLSHSLKMIQINYSSLEHIPHIYFHYSNSIAIF